MIAKLFLDISIVGAEWVLIVLIILSIVSVTLMLERVWFYRKASTGLREFRAKVRTAAAHENWADVKKAASERISSGMGMDLESGVVTALMEVATKKGAESPEILTELADDSIIRTRITWEKNLAFLATIGSNAPFIGLFGTVLGIMRAFRDLSQQAESGGAQTVSAGIAEALVATAIGLMVAIPAVIAFNLFQRKVKSALAQAEALKSFLIGKMAG
jgi:biopolymer transport protein ExbB